MLILTRTRRPEAEVGHGFSRTSCLPLEPSVGCQPAIVGGRRGLVLWWTAALWGLAGAAAVEGLDLYQAIHRVKDFPWRKEGEARFPAYLTSVIRRAIR